MKIKLAWAFMVVTLACLCWSANGKSLVWTGASSSNWSGSGNWKDTSTGAAASFANGDDVLFDDSAVNKLVCTDGDVAPNSVIFDSSETYVLSNRVNGAHTYGLAEGTKSFVKRGSGTLEIWAYGWGDNQGNCMTCGVDIVAGTIKAMVANKVNHLGNCKKPYTVTVRSGGRLWGTAHNLFGSL